MLYCLLPDIIFLRVIGVVGMVINNLKIYNPYQNDLILLFQIALLIYLFATLGITADK